MLARQRIDTKLTTRYGNHDAALIWARRERQPNKKLINTHEIGVRDGLQRLNLQLPRVTMLEARGPKPRIRLQCQPVAVDGDVHEKAIPAHRPARCRDGLGARRPVRLGQPGGEQRRRALRARDLRPAARRPRQCVRPGCHRPTALAPEAGPRAKRDQALQAAADAGRGRRRASVRQPRHAVLQGGNAQREGAGLLRPGHALGLRVQPRRGAARLPGGTQGRPEARHGLVGRGASCSGRTSTRR